MTRNTELTRTALYRLALQRFGPVKIRPKTFKKPKKSLYNKV